LLVNAIREEVLDTRILREGNVRPEVKKKISVIAE
jgi:hypothetical protein